MPREDIRDIMVNSPGKNFIFIIVITSLVLILLAAALFWIIKGRPSGQRIFGPPPDVVARERLGKIEGEMADLSPNEASLQISETVKDFLSKKYQDPIRYETTEEYLGRVGNLDGSNQSQIPANLAEQVSTFVSISQELKFAKLKEAKQQIPKMIERAEAIVTQASDQSQMS